LARQIQARERGVKKKKKKKGKRREKDNTKTHTVGFHPVLRTKGEKKPVPRF
jgi:hypothetical protein